MNSLKLTPSWWVGPGKSTPLPRGDEIWYGPRRGGEEGSRNPGARRRMEPGLAARRSEVLGRVDGATSARPLVRPAPRSAMFFPLVVLVAVLPGLYALNNWDLT